MYPYTRINASTGAHWRGRMSPVLPLIFILGVVAGTMLPIQHWVHWPQAAVHSSPVPAEVRAPTDSSATWTRTGNPNVRHPVDVIRTIDGDTFEARVHLWPGLDMTTRVRLRGIDAAELKAACPEELRLAEAASAALRDLLGEGSVTVYDIGPDKYNGRVVANAATGRTPNVSAAMLANGHARSYNGGHRGSWCSSASR
ncbi:MAG: thermonuclease family protein [Proteobacteria bacterium]|nr:thermonuclease family protein [Pseudomonadota bacterium]